MADRGARTILTVDDDAIVLLGTQAILERYGFRVLSSTSGEKAIEIVRSTPEIDLVLMDIDLGRGMDGTEAAKVILSERDLPLVFVSAHTERDVVEKTEGITSYGYIVKNSGETVMIASIKMAFRLHDAVTQLTDSRKQLQDISDSVPGVIYQFEISPSGDRRYTYMSEGSRDLFGIGSQEVMADASLMATVIADEDLEPLEREIRSSLETLEPGTLTHRVKTGNGSIRWVEACSMPHRRADGTVVWNGVALDVTARKEAEAVLEQQAAFERSVSERIPALVYVYDMKEQRNVWSNKEHKHFFGETTSLPSDALSLEDLQELAHPEDLAEVVRLTVELVAQGRDETIERPLRLRKGNDWRTVMLKIAPFERDEAGQIIRVIGSAVEVSGVELAGADKSGDGAST